MDDQNRLIQMIDEAQAEVNELATIVENIPRPPDVVSPTVNARAPKERNVMEKDENHYTKYMTLSTVKLFQTRGIEMFVMDDLVALYSISPQNIIKSVSEAAMLRIVKLQEGFENEFCPDAFLEVGDWVYPLSSRSPVLKSEQNYYIFPDLISATPGTSVGVVLPASVFPEVRSEFEDIILHFLALEEFPARPDRSGSTIKSNEQSTQAPRYGYGKKIGGGFKAGGELIAKGLQITVATACRAMDVGTENLKQVLTQQEPTDVPPLIAQGVGCARVTTDRVVDISAETMAKLAEMTSNLTLLTARYAKASVVPYVEQYIPTSNLQNETVDLVATEIVDLGSGIYDGAVVALTGLSTAGVMLTVALSAHVSDVLGHCYGSAAASLLSDAGAVVGNIAEVGNTANQMTSPKKLARKAAKTALLTCISPEGHVLRPSF